MLRRRTGGGHLRSFAAAVAAAAKVVRDPRDTVLPLVIGGNDMTFACHAGIATVLVREFLDEFRLRTARQETLAELAGPLTGTGAVVRPGGLTASAGIAIVKPHHPFSGAYELAADLCESAKVVKTAAPGRPCFLVRRACQRGLDAAESGGHPRRYDR